MARCVECKRMCAEVYQHVLVGKELSAAEVGAPDKTFRGGTLRALQVSAFKGCDLCRLLRGAFLVSGVKNFHKNSTRSFGVRVRGTFSMIELLLEKRLFYYLSISPCIIHPEWSGVSDRHERQLSGIAGMSNYHKYVICSDTRPLIRLL
jgi:hypothetical protein